MSDAHGDPVHETYHTGLRNLHALEVSAIELTERQVGRLGYEHFPDIAERLRAHKVESEEQARRLEQILQRHGSSTSTAKNAVSSVLGNVAAVLHAPAADEILKNTFANYAFEHQEIAAYTSLIAMAERLGDSQAIVALRQSLAEEEAMARFIHDRIVPITTRYMDIAAAGETAKT